MPPAGGRATIEAAEESRHFDHFNSSLEQIQAAFFYIFISKKPLFQGFSGWIYTNQRLTEPAMRRYVWRMPRMAMEYAWMFSGKAMPP